jgi:hypothetical protein
MLEQNIKIDFRGKNRGMDWIHLAQDRDQWRALLNTVVKLLVSESAGNFLSS